MTSHGVSVAIYAGFAVAGVILQLASRRADSAIPGIGAVLGRIMSTRTGRVGIMTAWAWLGLHFFAV